MFWLLPFLLSGCVSWNEEKKPPQLTQETPISSVIREALIWRGDVAKQARTLLKVSSSKKKQEALKELKRAWKGPEDLFPEALSLFLSCDPDHDQAAQLFSELASHPWPVQVEAWYLASAQPSQKMATAIETVLQSLLETGESEDWRRLWKPAVADAITKNNIKSLYAFLKVGLLGSGEAAFARGMGILNPDQASFDFLSYLSLARPEDLRQLHMESVNVEACLEILSFYAKHKFPWNADHSHCLFYYSVSRHLGLADLALAVLETGLEHESVAARMAQEPIWVQLALIENMRRHMTHGRAAFLKKLRTMSTERDINQEIDTISL